MIHVDPKFVIPGNDISALVSFVYGSSVASSGLAVVMSSSWWCAGLSHSSIPPLYFPNNPQSIVQLFYHFELKYQ